MKQTTLWIDPDNNPTCPKLTHGENQCIPFCELMGGPECHKFGGPLPGECPNCGAVCPNDLYCLNCGTMREGSV